jgi:hypothetical protein
MDLDDIEERLKALEQRLDAANKPVRKKLAALGPAGLFAVAAEEEAAAEVEIDRDARRVRLIAARAAQSLAERQVAKA